MTHPLPPSLATIVKAEAEKFALTKASYHEGVTDNAIQKWAGDDFRAGAQFLFAHLSEPGEACGPRALLGKVDYCDLRELLQARAALETEKRKRETEYQQAAEMHHDICAERDAAKAALASSEARVRILTLLCEGKDELLMAYRTGSAPRESTFKKIEKANQALLEVQP